MGALTNVPHCTRWPGSWAAARQPPRTHAFACGRSPTTPAGGTRHSRCYYLLLLLQLLLQGCGGMQPRMHACGDMRPPQGNTKRQHCSASTSTCRSHNGIHTPDPRPLPSIPCPDTQHMPRMIGTRARAQARTVIRGQPSLHACQAAAAARQPPNIHWHLPLRYTGAARPPATSSRRHHR